MTSLTRGIRERLGPKGCRFGAVATLRRHERFIPRLELLEERCVLDDTSAGFNGANARNLTRADGALLDGTGIDIGQVEYNRPGKPGFDSVGKYHPDVNPAEVYYRDGSANDPTKRDIAIQDHAVSVAGVMIADGDTNRGVAPRSSLLSSAAFWDTEATLDVQYQTRVISMQRVAGGYPSAINMSMGWYVAPSALNGSSTWTLGLDWSARVHNVVYVVSRGNGRQSSGVVPADNYNGITVAATQKDSNGVYDTMWKGAGPDDENNYTSRSDGAYLTDLVAPGVDVTVPRISPTVTYEGGAAGTGTSFAAPHVAGAVALLQQYAVERVINSGDPRWNPHAYQHEVMKAVLMNSADKIQDSPLAPPTYCEMQKTIYDTDGTTVRWWQSDARDDPVYNNSAGRSKPLDQKMGTGQLNVGRALAQFDSGEIDPPQAPDMVPSLVGWDYGSVSGSGIIKYRFGPLSAGKYISATLTWDRIVTLNDTNGNGKYDAGETFSTPPLIDDLDLYLMPINGTDPATQNYWTSVSSTYNVEHMFLQLPAGVANGCELWVYRHYPDTGSTNYALAWWITGPGAVAQRPMLAAPSSPSGVPGTGQIATASMTTPVPSGIEALVPLAGSAVTTPRRFTPLPDTAPDDRSLAAVLRRSEGSDVRASGAGSRPGGWSDRGLADPSGLLSPWGTNDSVWLGSDVRR